jgi:hypothetical protein
VARCATCKNIILFGGLTEGPYRFCNQRCHSAGVFLKLAEVIPEDIVQQQAATIHGGPCPVCRGQGPIDFHTSTRCMSFVFMTTTQNREHLMCRRCARSKIGEDLLITCLAGWWGFPFGLIFTPIAIGRNIKAMSSGPDPAQPSAALHNAARMFLAREVEAEARSPQSGTGTAPS